MKTTIIVLSLLMMTLLAACTGVATPATPAEPTAPAAEESATEGSESATVDPNLVGVNWQWEQLQQDGEVIDVQAEKGQYLLFLNEDETFSVGLDCNQGAGDYVASGDDAITMNLGPMTMAVCSPDSLSNQLVGMFGPPLTYAFSEDNAVVTFTGPEGHIYTFRDVASMSGESAASPVDAAEHVADPALINKLWMWERRDPNGNQVDEIIVPNPTDYTIFFTEEGEYMAKMDCRAMQGGYATFNDSGIQIEPGPTMAIYCGDDALDTEMEASLAAAARYEIQEDGTVLALASAADGPINYYRQVQAVELPGAGEDAAAPTATVTAPDGVFLRTGPGTNYPYVGAAPQGASGTIIGVSEDGGWWLVEAPNLPEGQVWVSAQYVDAANADDVPVVEAQALDASLIGIPWMWVYTMDPVIGTQPVVEYMNYVILFNEDGTADIKADCNNVLANYTVDGSSISIELGPTTMVACEGDSLDSDFLAQLSSAALYRIEGGQLYLDLMADGGTMRFIPSDLSAAPGQ